MVGKMTGVSWGVKDKLKPHARSGEQIAITLSYRILLTISRSTVSGSRDVNDRSHLGVQERVNGVRC